MQLNEGTFVLFVQFSEGTFALNMQFDKGTLRLFMQFDEGKLSLVGTKTKLLPAHLFTHLQKFSPRIRSCLRFT